LAVRQGAYLLGSLLGDLPGPAGPDLAHLAYPPLPARAPTKGSRTGSGSALGLIGSNIFQAQGFKRLTLDFLAGKLYAER